MNLGGYQCSLLGAKGLAESSPIVPRVVSVETSTAAPFSLLFVLAFHARKSGLRVLGPEATGKRGM